MSFRTVPRLLPAFALLLAGSLLFPTPGPAQPTPQVSALDSSLIRVDTMRAQGDYREALSRLTHLRNQYGDEVDILWRMSLTHVDVSKVAEGRSTVNEHFQQALQLSNKALTVNTSNAHAHLAKAVAEERLTLTAGVKERVQRARTVKKHADRAIELDSTLDRAYHMRALWHREVADLGFLERIFVKAIHGGLSAASFEQSVRDFKRAIELRDERFHHLELAKTYLKMNRTADAKKELLTVLDLPPRTSSDERYGNQAREILNDFE